MNIRSIKTGFLTASLFVSLCLQSFPVSGTEKSETKEEEARQTEPVFVPADKAETEPKPADKPNEAKPACTQDPCKIESQLQLLSYSVETKVDQKDKPLEDWKEGEAANVTLFFKEAGLKTSQLCKEDAKKDDKITEVDAAELLCGFSQPKSVEVILLSEKDQPLLFQVIYQDVIWQGKSSTFAYSIGYPSLKLPYTTGKVDISQARVPKPEEPEPAPPVINITNEIPGSPAVPISPVFPTPAEPEAPSVPAAPEVPGEEPEEPGKEVPAPAPNIIISHYAYGGQQVQAGSDFTLTIEFLNTSKTIPVENIVMQVETDPGLSITNASNTYYFEVLQPRYNLQQKISLRALGTEQGASPSVSVSFNYEYVENSQRLTRSNSEKISIPVTEPDRMEITPAVLLEEQPVFGGQELALSFPYVNKGKGTLYNVSAVIEGDMESLLPVQNLGNFEAGKSGSVDMILTPTTPGEHEFSVVITYEDASGKEIKKTFPYKVNVQEMQTDDPIDTPDFPGPEQPQQGGLSWGWILIVGLLGLTALVFLLVKRKKIAKHQAGAEDETDYFADEDEVLPDEDEEEEEDDSEEDEPEEEDSKKKDPKEEAEPQNSKQDAKESQSDPKQNRKDANSQESGNSSDPSLDDHPGEMA